MFTKTLNHAFKIHLFFTLSILFTSFLSGQIFQGPEADLAIIKENINKFFQHYMNGAIDKLTQCYTTDGKIFPNGSKIFVGHAAIEKMWTVDFFIKHSDFFTK